MSTKEWLDGLRERKSLEPWSKEKPKEGGIYWCKYPDGTVAIGEFGEAYKDWTELGSNYSVGLKCLNGNQFIGPIPVPDA